jgi:hypothetical protein
MTQDLYYSVEISVDNRFPQEMTGGADKRDGRIHQRVRRIKWSCFSQVR